MVKKLVLAVAMAASATLFAWALPAAESWTMGAPGAWSREKGAVKLEVLPDGTLLLARASRSIQANDGAGGF